jgi:hypothetical protein
MLASGTNRGERGSNLTTLVVALVRSTNPEAQQAILPSMLQQFMFCLIAVVRNVLVLESLSTSACSIASIRMALLSGKNFMTKVE